MFPDKPLTEDDLKTLSNTLVNARKQATVLETFPGDVPTTLDAAYRVQDMSLEQWNDEITGWKVGMVIPELRDQMGAERLMGPIFKKVTHFIGRPHADDEFVELEVYAGGMVAVEAELVFELGEEITPGSIDTKGPLKHLIKAVYAGVEIASSPVIDLNSYGPTAIISDFGVNQGMVIGARIASWDTVIENMQTSVFINKDHINTAPSNNVLRGPMAAVAYLIDQAAARNITLPKGCMICSGAITGVHDTVAGATSTVTFEGVGNINMKLIPVSA
ncbi:2-keto-4-pentenoate hydratase [Alteromonas sp. S005]|uniref:2-keto-4-pentenoate hydratase n=1 Tax=Alteromonas sp. S005 TaxID=3117400 RepID=UPI002FE3237D